MAAYARLRGRLAGYITTQSPPPGEIPEIRLTAIRPILGFVEPPTGFDPRRVTVRVSGLENPADPTIPNRDWSRRFAIHTPGLEAPWRSLFVRPAGADGRFEFRDVPAGSHVELSAEAEGLGRATATVPSPRPSGTRIEMFLEGIIAGSFAHEDTGAPAGGVPLRATSSGSFETETDGAGRFAFRGLPDDGWTLAARAPVRAAPGVVTEGIDLRLERGAVVSGTVADAATRRPLRAKVCAGAKQGTLSVTPSMRPHRCGWALCAAPPARRVRHRRCRRGARVCKRASHDPVRSRDRGRDPF